MIYGCRNVRAFGIVGCVAVSQAHAAYLAGHGRYVNGSAGGLRVPRNPGTCRRYVEWVGIRSVKRAICCQAR